MQHVQERITRGEARQVAQWLLARHSRGRLSAREIGDAIRHAMRLVEEKLRKGTTFQRRVAAL